MQGRDFDELVEATDGDARDGFDDDVGVSDRTVEEEEPVPRGFIGEDDVLDLSGALEIAGGMHLMSALTNAVLNSMRFYAEEIRRN